jgi:hypothetical protein
VILLTLNQMELNTRANGANTDDSHEEGMLLPPEAVYQTQEELFQSIQAWAFIHGYCFVVRRSKKRATKSKQIYYACDRSGKFTTNRANGPYTRQSGTKKTDCQFSLVAQESADGWEVQHRHGSQYSVHNHEASSGPIAHPGHRKWLAQRQETVKDLGSAGKWY